VGDIPKQVEVAGSEGVAVVVLLGEGSAAAA
jgi:hypothetical protein